MHFKYVDPFSGCDILESLVVVYDGIVNRNSAQNGRAFSHKLSSEGLSVPERRKIHDRFSTHGDSLVYFLHFHIHIQTVSGCSKVDIDLCFQGIADAERL